MLTILLGPDSFSKKEYIQTLAEKSKAEVAFFYAADELPHASELTEQNLFSKSKVFGVFDSISKFDLSELIVKQFIESGNQIVFVEEKLDKRSNVNKELLANKSITVKDFPLPHGKELNKWIEQRVKQSGGVIDADAVEALAIKVGRDDAVETKFGGRVVEVKEIYNLWQVSNEIAKLISYANGNPITKQDVDELVSENREVEVFSIVNAIGEHDQLGASLLLQEFLKSDTASDEKARIIQLTALLAEQFRSILMVQGFLSQRYPDSEILNQTGWKSGRLFMVKKIAYKFPEKKVVDFLNKLELLDEELKTTGTPPKVLLDLIFSQLF
jgi:DNA polymerase III delta subunit